MAYRYDEDLEFLKKIDSEDLNHLVSVLTHDLKDGKTRYTETLMASTEYKKYFPDHTKYWERIAEEIQCFGGNTAANLLRLGKGVEYKEILMDVCDVLKVNYSKKSATNKIEEQFLGKMLDDALEQMSPEEKKKFLRDASASAGITKSFVTMSNVVAVDAIATSNFFISILIKQIMKETLIFAGGKAVVAAPLSIIAMPLNAALMGYQMAGPAYRVTIPVCICIADLRKKAEVTIEEACQYKQQRKAYENLANIVRDSQKTIRNYQEIDKEFLGRFVLLREAGKFLGLPDYTEAAWALLNLGPKMEKQVNSLAEGLSFENFNSVIQFVHQVCLLDKEYIQRMITQLRELVECEAQSSQIEFKTKELNASFSQTLALL